MNKGEGGCRGGDGQRGGGRGVEEGVVAGWMRESNTLVGFVAKTTIFVEKLIFIVVPFAKR